MPNDATPNDLMPDDAAPNDAAPDESSRLAELIGELAGLSTEQADTARGDLDLLPTLDLVHAMNAEDRRVPEAVAAQADRIAEAVDGITARFRRGGRLVYLGAGTAGRVGVLDASECPPTFGTDPGMVVGLIAGGDGAIRSAVEDAEDDARAAAAALAERGLTEADTVVGISASGRTPYVLGGLGYAREVGAFTVAISANAGSAIGAAADVPIEVVVGPEFVTGSTRLKAGTAQKLVANMLSTLSMIRLGKTYRGVMVDLRATNEKLRARSVRTLIQLTGAAQDDAVRALAEADGSVKLALLLLFTGAPVDEAAPALAAANGILRDAIAALG
jgi:N-acetylmuramic acid 6-phosphate etherase